MPRFNKLILLALTFMVLSFASASVVRADSVTITASDSGWYRQDGFHDAANKNYLAGTTTATIKFNNYFTFNLTGISGTITGATLRLFNNGNGYQGPPGTYTLYDVLIPISTLSASHSGGDATGAAIHNDLGSGIVYGSVDVSNAINGGTPPFNTGTVVTINLNAAALAALNANNGGVFAIGGSFFSPTAAPGSVSYIFAGTSENSTRQLVLTTSAAAVPEPSTWLLLGTGLTGIGVMLKRRRKAN